MDKRSMFHGEHPLNNTYKRELWIIDHYTRSTGDRVPYEQCSGCTLHRACADVEGQVLRSSLIQRGQSRPATLVAVVLPTQPVRQVQ